MSTTIKSRVWEICDRMNGATRAAMLAECIRVGINRSTAAIQISHWLKTTPDARNRQTRARKITESIPIRLQAKHMLEDWKHELRQVQDRIPREVRITRNSLQNLSPEALRFIVHNYLTPMRAVIDDAVKEINRLAEEPRR